MGSEASEINRGYNRHIANLHSHTQQTAEPGFFQRLMARLLWGNEIRAFLFPLLISYAFGLAGVLSVYRLFKKKPAASLHRLALANINYFIKQYPFHLYPLVAKTLELAFIQEKFLKQISRQDRIIELAVGDGTFSRLVFSDQDLQITALDLNPYSLFKTYQDRHIRQRVIGDCIQPPVMAGRFDWLIANNFLHHITRKEKALAYWSEIAPQALFNENTFYWASSWTVPYLLSRSGASFFSHRAAEKIEAKSCQKLLTGQELNRIVSRSYNIEEQASFMDTHTFFLCSVFSYLLRCFGPPTPAAIKRLVLGVARFLSLALTAKVARLLIFFDSCRSRQADAFISYLGKSKNFQPAPGQLSGTKPFKCPDCGHNLENNFCPQCKNTFQEKDGLLFLLGKEHQDILAAYNPAVHKKVPTEHL